MDEITRFQFGSDYQFRLSRLATQCSAWRFSINTRKWWQSWKKNINWGSDMKRSGTALILSIQYKKTSITLQDKLLSSEWFTFDNEQQTSNCQTTFICCPVKKAEFRNGWNISYQQFDCSGILRNNWALTSEFRGFVQKQQNVRWIRRQLILSLPVKKGIIQ